MKEVQGDSKKRIKSPQKSGHILQVFHGLYIIIESDCQEKQNPDRRKQRFPEGMEERRGKSLLQNKGREKETKNE